jgi:copper(I)-binding protein
MRLAVILLATTLLACGTPKPPLVISELEVTNPIPGRHMSAGFFILTNNTDEVISITGVNSPQFTRVEIHETTLADGVSRMRALDVLEVPAHGSVVLERGGKHLMLIQARNIGDSVTLQFVSGDAPVLSVDYVFPKDN